MKNVDKGTALLLIVASAFEVLAMMHHPHVEEPDIGRALRTIVAMTGVAQWVHGILIALILAVTHCLGEFVRSRPSHALMRAGTLAYVAGIVLVVGAASVNGWALERLVAALPRESAMDLDIAQRLVMLCAAFNQTWTKLGVVLTSTGIVLVSTQLWRADRAWRSVGILGCVSGTISALAIAFGGMRMDVAGALVMLVAQAGWCMLVGVVWWRSTLPCAFEPDAAVR